MDTAMEALIRAHAACRIALDALPGLPDEVREAVEEPLTRVCDVVGPELERRAGRSSADAAA